MRRITFLLVEILLAQCVWAQNIELARTAKGVKSQQIIHAGYTTNYNAGWLIPNWVAWQLTRKEANGAVKRPNHQFVQDPMVRGRQAEHRDYTNSGYDRGHMCPAADSRWSTRAMEESFYLSNICPQNPSLNSGMWNNLEDRCRNLAKESGSVYICCGPIMAKNHKSVGKSGVAVPSYFFKVICMKRKGKWQAIGFIIPNIRVRSSMFQYAVSVDEVEKRTGHDFFYNLPDNIERAIEAKYNIKDWM